MKRIAILSSGTDNCGINSAIRSATRKAISKGLKVFGVHWGFRGLVEDRFEVLNSRSVSGILSKAGSMLGTAKPGGAMEEADMKRVLYNLNKNSIGGVIVIGGSSSMRLSQLLIKNGIPVVGVPATLQDDIVGIDIALGVDSAVNNIMDCLDHIRSCDNSRNRSFLIEVEGRNCGSLALRAATVTGCELCLVPEIPCNDVGAIADKMNKVINSGKTQCLTMISAGWKPGIEALSKAITERDNETDLVVRKTILGYVQRGGSPSAFDRLLGTQLGAAAVEALAEGQSGHIVGPVGGAITRIPYAEFMDKKKGLDPLYFDLFESTSST